MSYQISTTICRKCGLCEKACKFKAITKDRRQYKIHSNKCVNCGHCSVACPYGAITLQDGSLPEGIIKKRAECQDQHRNYQKLRRRRKWIKIFILVVILIYFAYVLTGS